MSQSKCTTSLFKWMSIWSVIVRCHRSSGCSLSVTSLNMHAKESKLYSSEFGDLVRKTNFVFSSHQLSGDVCFSSSPKDQVNHTEKNQSCCSDKKRITLTNTHTHTHTHVCTYWLTSDSATASRHRPACLATAMTRSSISWTTDRTGIKTAQTEVEGQTERQ